MLLHPLRAPPARPTAKKILAAALTLAALVACGGGADAPSPSTLSPCNVGPAVAIAAPPVRPPQVPGAPFQPALELPSGNRSLGKVSLHLVDTRRSEAWNPARPQRELMVSLWYPARHDGPEAQRPVAAYMTPQEFARNLQAEGFPAGAIAAPLTHAREAAPLDRRDGTLPVLLYSPGGASSRAVNTALVEELVSRGYAVLTIDHTYDANAVEFPGGRIEMRRLPPAPSDYAPIIEVRTQDARFVLDALVLLQLGVNPDADKRNLPAYLAGAFDLERIGMFGSSLGGSTTMSTMWADPRIKAGLSLDSQPYGPVAQDGLDRPFMMMNAKASRAIPGLASFWAQLRSWRRELRMQGAGHVAYSDFATLVPQFAPALGLSPEDVAEVLGTVDPQRAISVQRAYVLAFFDRHLRASTCNALLDGPSALFPEVVFVP